ncbi:MAG: ATP-binding protein, partial [Armatimonadetes bacterium]|nr:ATP-binding protein [Armatimonadota bacterium]
MKGISAEIRAGELLGIIGPNGSGKTKYGIKLSQLNNADHIGALRNIALQENLPMMSHKQAEDQFKNQLTRRKSNYWELSNEIDILFSKLMAEDSASAIRFRDMHVKGHNPDLEETKIMELKKLWENIFPEREINFEGYNPKVTSKYMGGNSYSAKLMSDGERVALYLAARVLDSANEFIIVDEPEVHFHSKLAVLFWDLLEDM